MTFLIKRRLWRRKGGWSRYRVRLPEQEDHTFLALDEHRIGRPGLALWWDRVHIEDFPSYEDLLVYLCRFAYSVGQEELVPSTVLEDSGLMYKHLSWVDTWGVAVPPAVDLSSEVVFGVDQSKPRSPLLQFETYLSVGHGLVRIPPSIGDAGRESQDLESQEPRVLLRPCPPNWRDMSDPTYELWASWKKTRRCRITDREGTTTLKSGKAAVRHHSRRKRRLSALRD